jgi:8-oxo-dGTP pyrophosphatase MutT (NUDIX family)
METTRHFTATVYVVHDGATALHLHEKLDMWLPPGGHIDRDELPHETAVREVEEEIGTKPTLCTPDMGIESESARAMPQPQQFLLFDVDVYDGEVVHQHIDFVYYGSVDQRDITPQAGEAPIDDWEWFTPADLRENRARLESDVIKVGCEAIETIGREESK